VVANNQQSDVFTTISAVALIGIVFYTVFVSTSLA
jgi:hypothetical protein